MGATDSFRVLICDDSLGFPSLVRSWLQADGRFDVIGLATGGEEAKQIVEAEHPDVLVLDLVLPDVPDSTVLVRDLRELHPALKIVLVSSLQMDQLRNAAQASGTDGVCNKGATAEELTSAVYAVASGAGSVGSGDGSTTQNVAP